MCAQVWSLDVDAAEQQLAVGGVSPQLQLYGIHSDSAAGSESSASKQVRRLLPAASESRVADQEAAVWEATRASAPSQDCLSEISFRLLRDVSSVSMSG